jgi:UDP-N-acetylmuramoylalanine--D-glutamate ligase
MRWEGKRVLIVGLGKSGLAAVRFLVQRGAVVSATDERVAGEFADAIKSLDGLPVKLHLGGHSRDLFLDQDVIVPSPGVAWDHPHLVAAREHGVETVGELDVASEFLKGHVIGVTGTNGKTTTVSLIGHMMKLGGYSVSVAGNIGTPLLATVEESHDDQWHVLELSSFQLEAAKSFRCDIAVVLNVTPDHLDRHHSFENYIDAKRRIFDNQGQADFAVLNADDRGSRDLADGLKSKLVWFSREHRNDQGASVDSEGIAWNGQHVCDLELLIKGPHNLENALAAVASAALAGVKLDAIGEALKTFQPVEHRLEFVRDVAGVAYYNDSKATNVDAALKACQAFDRGLWIILGGRDKGSDYHPLSQALKGRARGVLLIGEAASTIRGHLNGSTPIEEVATMARALEFARSNARPGDSVVLAPACASFDQFANYAERGLEFKRLVKELEA